MELQSVELNLEMRPTKNILSARGGMVESARYKELAWEQFFPVHLEHQFRLLSICYKIRCYELRRSNTPRIFSPL